jgi:hypothetical protein
VEKNVQLKYRIYRRRNGVFYWQENDSQKQGTLRTSDKREAERLLSNPTTYVWKKVTGTGALAEISLQKVTKTKRMPSGMQIVQISVDNYILQVIDRRSGGVQLTINTEQSENLKPQLEKIFDAVTATIARAGIDFLGKVLESN